jgi:hypothetical protein
MRGINYKLWNGDVGQRITETLRNDYPDRDTFFVSSAAYDAGISERTLRNYLRVDSTLEFIDRLPGGSIATCSQSMRAWGESRTERDGRKKLTTWESNFARDVRVTDDVQVTDVSSGSAVSAGSRP